MGRKKKKMKKGIITDGEDDRISKLPEPLIHHILSFLMMRDVTRTCLLSKRWRNIWKSAPVLRFGRRWHDHPGDNDLIDQSLNRYEGQKVKTLQVHLNCRRNAGRLESWFRFAAMHGVEELDMDTDVNEMPSCLFECLEMRVLRLSLEYCSSLRPFRFPLLSELHFTDLSSSYFDTSACPLLEVLTIQSIHTYGHLEIHAPNPKLRYLKISDTSIHCDGNSSITFYAPNALHFEFVGSFRRSYQFKDISSVKTASIESSEDQGEEMAQSLVGLLRNLTHVQSLKLYQACILVLAYGETIGLEIPSLSATCLEFQTNFSKFVFVGIKSLLRASRCIERLVINMEYFTLPNEVIFEDHDIDAVKVWESLEQALSVELALNTILIQNFPGFFPECHHDWFNVGMEMKLVEALLKSSKMLNKMNISIMKSYSQPLNLQFLYELTKKLLVLPRASANAKVYFS